MARKRAINNNPNRNFANLGQFRRDQGLLPKKGKVRHLSELTDEQAQIDAYRAVKPDGNYPTVEELRAKREEEDALGVAWVWDVFPQRAAGWKFHERYTNGLVAYRADGLRLIATGAAKRNRDGALERWLHLSVSRPKGVPSYYDLKAVKRDFVGDRFFAYQVFPPAQENVSLYEVLHLWVCVDRPMYLPDFTYGWDML